MQRILIATSNPGKLRDFAGAASSYGIDVPPDQRTGRFVCVIAAARDGETLAVFRGTAEGIILDRPRGSNGFGYDPLFYFPQIRKTFAELSAEQKAQFSHRGAAFRAFLEWYRNQSPGWNHSMLGKFH